MPILDEAKELEKKKKQIEGEYFFNVHFRNLVWQQI